MIHREDQQLNYPVKRYFEKKLKCALSRSEFKFIAGTLDVLAYDRENICFHVCEGKRSSNVASVGHAVGQLIAYMSMIQENGYDFLDKVSKGERLELSDFATFLENKAINVCFYVALPERNREKLLNPAQLMLNNMGVFGRSIGIFFASKKKCELAVPAKPVSIKIRRIYDRKDFFIELKRKFFSLPESAGIEEVGPHYNYCVQFKEEDGHGCLHYEITFKKRRKIDKTRLIEVGFHLEFAKAHIKHQNAKKRIKKLKRVMAKVRTELKRKGLDFRFQPIWGKQWARVFTIYKASQVQLDDKILDEVLILFKELIRISKPMFDRVNWGRKRRQKEES